MAAAEPTLGSGAEVTVDDHAAEEEEGMADRSRYWLQSCVTEDHLAELVEGGFLPPKAECSWQAPDLELVLGPKATNASSWSRSFCAV